MSEDAPPPYDPRARQPLTLGELHRWMLVAAASQRATLIPPPVPLDRPPIPGLDRLAAFCMAKYGQYLSSERVDELIGAYALARNVSIGEAKAASLQSAADTLAPTHSPAAAAQPSPYHQLGDVVHGHELDQVAGGNEKMHYNFLDPRDAEVERRLRGLDATYAGAVSTPDPAEGPLLDTRPDGPVPPASLVEAAMRDVPRAMADQESTREFYAPAPSPGQKIVLHHRLVRELTGMHRHGKAASEWAIHRLVESRMLTARYGHRDQPAWVTRDGVRHGGGSYEVQELKFCLLGSTDRLWEWWRTLESNRDESRTQESFGVQPLRSSAAPPAPPVPVEQILNRATCRQERLAQLRVIEDRLGPRIARLVDALRSFEATIPQGAADCLDQLISPDRREALADALLSVCQAIREGEFSRGMERLLEGDRKDARDNVRLAIDLYRRAWGRDRRGVMEWLGQLDGVLPRGDNFDSNAASQLGVWDAVRASFGAFIPWPPRGSVHPWHPDAVEATRLQEELAPRPSQGPDATPGRPAEGGETDAAPQQPADVQGPAPATEIDLEAQALALLFQNPEWTVARIADHLGVDRKTPYKWKRFRQAAELKGKIKPRGPKDRNPRRGYKTADGRVEALADGDDDE